ncbi:MAG TPA: riboflavin biosynthesis protein RibF [Terracidiphilus sp.]|nr:riboflavin biosynthesis protein RibF [Terracidiphilus sp.]
MSKRSRPEAAVYRSLDEIPADFGPSVAAIGNFDGVHRGHQEVLAATVAEAREKNARSVALTFEPHPEKFLRPANAPRLLTPLDERVRLLKQTGVAAVVVLRFDAALAQMRAKDFARHVLAGGLRVEALHEGASFRFGYRAEAGVAELVAFGVEMGFVVHVHPAVRVHGLEVSSSVVRKFVAAGEMKQARWMLGRPFGVRSRPARGRGEGTRLLVPTVNLAEYGELLPAHGVYVTRLRIGERCFDAVTNVGDRPTFDGAGFGIETHILDFEPMELSEHTALELEFLLRLRDEERWPSVDALRAQIGQDVARAKRYFRLAARIRMPNGTQSRVSAE